MKKRKEKESSAIRYLSSFKGYLGIGEKQVRPFVKEKNTTKTKVIVYTMFDQKLQHVNVSVFCCRFEYGVFRYLFYVYSTN